ncbi:uncharacterized protein LOC143150326 [Ptiloglossa arizonensis]|uniref:uncharacterized protein LOC143150326 n=1 Tax=Ptiloglossa arizonensis TaxID=3350558 RepID=UPI003F9F5273
MDDLNDQHYTLSRVFLSFIGLWPYENTLFAYVKRVFCILILTSCVIFQITALLRDTKCTRDLVLSTITNIVLTTVFVIKWCTFWHHINDIKKHIDAMRDNWTYIKNVNERKIILKYIDHGLFLSHLFTCSIYLTMGGLLIYLTWMNTLNATTDETENSVKIEIRMDYLTEGETSPYVTLLHIYVAILLGTTTILGAEITAVLFLCHACGLFRVVCYHVKNTFSDELLKTTDSRRNKAVHDRLVSAAKVHKRALQYCKETEATLGPSYLVLMVLGVCCLSLNLLRLSQALLEKELSSLLVQLALIFICFLYLFMANYMGQIVMDNSSMVFLDT